MSENRTGTTILIEEFIKQIPHLLKKLKTKKLDVWKRNDSMYQIAYTKKVDLDIRMSKVQQYKRKHWKVVENGVTYSIDVNKLTRSGNHSSSTTLFFIIGIVEPSPFIELYNAMETRYNEILEKNEQDRQKRKLASLKKSISTIRSLGK